MRRWCVVLVVLVGCKFFAKKGVNAEDVDKDFYCEPTCYKAEAALPDGCSEDNHACEYRDSKTARAYNFTRFRLDQAKAADKAKANGTCQSAARSAIAAARGMAKYRRVLQDDKEWTDDITYVTPDGAMAEDEIFDKIKEHADEATKLFKQCGGKDLKISLAMENGLFTNKKLPATADIDPAQVDELTLSLDKDVEGFCKPDPITIVAKAKMKNGNKLSTKSKDADQGLPPDAIQWAASGGKINATGVFTPPEKVEKFLAKGVHITGTLGEIEAEVDVPFTANCEQVAFVGGQAGENGFSGSSGSQDGEQGKHAGDGKPGKDAAPVEVWVGVRKVGERTLGVARIQRGGDDLKFFFDLEGPGLKIDARGGRGGRGGSGGRGGNGSDDECRDGGPGGSGGDGGNGSDGANGAKVTVHYDKKETRLKSLVVIDNGAGPAGDSGGAGDGGTGGQWIFQSSNACPNANGFKRGPDGPKGRSGRGGRAGKAGPPPIWTAEADKKVHAAIGVAETGDADAAPKKKAKSKTKAKSDGAEAE